MQAGGPSLTPVQKAVSLVDTHTDHLGPCGVTDVKLNETIPRVSDAELPALNMAILLNLEVK